MEGNGNGKVQRSTAGELPQNVINAVSGFITDLDGSRRHWYWAPRYHGPPGVNLILFNTTSNVPQAKRLRKNLEQGNIYVVKDFKNEMTGKFFRKNRHGWVVEIGGKWTGTDKGRTRGIRPIDLP